MEEKSQKYDQEQVKDFEERGLWVQKQPEN